MTEDSELRTTEGRILTFEPGGWRSYYCQNGVTFLNEEESLLDAMRTIEYGEGADIMAGIGVVDPRGSLIPYRGGAITIDDVTKKLDSLIAEEEADARAQALAYWSSLTDDERGGALRVGEALQERPVAEPGAAGEDALRSWVRAWRALQ